MIQRAYKLMHEGTLAFARAERQGFRLDLDLAKEQSAKLTKTIKKLTKKIESSKFYKDWGKSTKGKVNLNSNPQLSKYLYKVKKLKPAKETKTGQGSTDEEALEALHIPELTDMLRVRKLKKLRDTYLESFMREEVNGFIHPSYNLHIPVTYRSSSDSPNFQNIPIRDEESRAAIRKTLFARIDHQLAELDFKGIEVGVGACYHKDPMMIKYVSDSKTDMHRDMAKQIFFLNKFDAKNKAHNILRSGAKNGFVFPQFYGDYYGNNVLSLAKWASLPLKGRWQYKDGIMLEDNFSLVSHFEKNNVRSLKGFTNHLKRIEKDFWEERFPVYNEWKKNYWLKYQKKGFLKMKTGFICSGVMNRNNVINSPIQGTAFHCLLWCFNRLDKIMRKRKWQTRLIGQIHDSIIFDIYPPERDEVLQTALDVTTRQLPKAWPWIIVPMRIDVELCEVNESWYYKKAIKI